MLPPPMTTQTWHAEVVDFLHLIRTFFEGGGVDGSPVPAAEHFAAQLEDDALVFDGGGGGLGRHWSP
jgi:hypothetical protein